MQALSKVSGSLGVHAERGSYPTCIERLPMQSPLSLAQALCQTLLASASACLDLYYRNSHANQRSFLSSVSFISEPCVLTQVMHTRMHAAESVGGKRSSQFSVSYPAYKNKDIPAITTRPLVVGAIGSSFNYR